MTLPRTSAGIRRSASVHGPGSHPYSTAADYERDFRLLHARPGCGLAELKRAHRVAVRSLHPDANPELANDAGAQGRLTELNAAWRRLAEYHRIHGRLPFAGVQPTAAEIREQPAGADAGRSVLRGRGATIGVALMVAGAWFAWLGTRPESPAGDPSTTSAAPAPVVAKPVSGFATGAESEPVAARLVKLGDRKSRVREILGPPILKMDDNWEYGPSYVRFKDGRAVDWYSSPLNPIAVDETSRDGPGSDD